MLVSSISAIVEAWALAAVCIAILLLPPLWLPTAAALFSFLAYRWLRQFVFKPTARHAHGVIKQRVNAWIRALHNPGRWTPPQFQRKTLRVRDGVLLHYFVIPAQTPSSKPAPKRVMLLCCPLGGQGFKVFLPAIHYYQNDNTTFITWDYRGLFSSGMPERGRRIAIPEHAEDAREILRAEGVEVADVVLGHSMGVAVSLELATLYPGKVGSLVLLNGAHGQVFSSAFQPMFRVPVMGDFARGLVAFLITHHTWLNAIRVASRPFVHPMLTIYALLFGDRNMRKLLGTSYLADFFYGYLGDVCETEQTTLNFLRLFQELDAHSIYHHLHTIEHPTLIISGFFDTVTPMYHSQEMARLMPNAKHVIDFFSSHATILENPTHCIEEVAEFVDSSQRRFVRKSSTSFGVVY